MNSYFYITLSSGGKGATQVAGNNAESAINEYLSVHRAHIVNGIGHLIELHYVRDGADKTIAAASSDDR